MGSALTAGHFWKEPKSNQKALAPTLGTSLTLGVPVIRQVFGGPPEIKSRIKINSGSLRIVVTLVTVVATVLCR